MSLFGSTCLLLLVTTDALLHSIQCKATPGAHAALEGAPLTILAPPAITLLLTDYPQCPQSISLLGLPAFIAAAATHIRFLLFLLLLSPPNLRTTPVLLFFLTPTTPFNLLRST
jgi:hypothetical protein